MARGALAGRETYVSLDVEIDGEVPGLSSMLSIGAGVVVQGTIASTFTANLELLPGAKSHPATMAWWSRYPEEWSMTRQNARPPEEVIPEFVAWLDSLPGDHRVAVGAPAAVDFSFVNYYCHRFAGRNPLGYACLDILSLAMGRFGTSGYWDLEHTLESVLNVEREPTLRRHVALDDAIQQARVLIALLDRSR